MIDFTLTGTNVYKVYFVSKFKTEEYKIMASSEDEIKEFLLFTCFIFGKHVKRSNKSISELFDQNNYNFKINRISFSFARGCYSYVKDIIKEETPIIIPTIKNRSPTSCRIC